MAGNPKEKSNDRVLVLRRMEGKSVKGSTGIIDNQLFTGGNVLHAMLDESSRLWSLKYDHGGVPPSLKQKWTSFRLLMQDLERYLSSRNVEIKEIID